MVANECKVMLHSRKQNALLFCQEKKNDSKNKLEK